MQVVYSGGSSTPNPSPRLQRKAYIGGYGRPILPGYLAGNHSHVVVTHRSKEKLTEGDTSLRDSIPAMTKPVAVSCLILNILVPGFGTLMAGLSVLCCSEAREKCLSKKTVVWVNSGVALLQFVTAFLFLLGWIWSIMWGAAFISISTEYYKTKQVQHTRHDHSVKISPKRDRDEFTQSPSPTTSCDHIHHVHSSPLTSDKHLNMYLAPPASSSSQTQTIIVLQEPPVVNHSEDKPAPSQPIMNARTRHQKILQRQMSDNQLSPFTLTNERLEAIVIHDAVPPCAVRHIREQHRDSMESLSDTDEHVGK
ncbi:uncharacterized protein LOC121370946 [Gigantopelta aegis]|uniref:uncharacterized protein LOC121370946 n=1 Tax=Gigantopelta aegis TaxID=1735272 RepID=UPI001B887ED5|nr:uncharacterized protein LOC121370946 [Gigantopelta aegis]